MIVIRLMGGLGNQMFQYAFGRAMALTHHCELVLDQSLLLDKSAPHEEVTHRNYDLDIFNLTNFRWATPEEVFLFNGNPNANLFKKVFRILKNKVSPKKLVIQSANAFSEKYLQIQTSTCFVGRWQSELFFKNQALQIKSDFKIKVAFTDEVVKFQEIISSCNAVCLHMRRGDLISSNTYSNSIGALSWSYYETALAYMNQQISNPTYFIFSDDSEWCKQNIKLTAPTFFMDNTTAGNKAEGHLHLMQHCQHFIISNSTFAWWAAYLSQTKANQLVIYPKNWYKKIELQNPEMCPTNWISI